MTSFRGGYTLGSADNARSPRLPNSPSTAWDSALSAEDKKAYAQFFKFADEENKGFITGDEAVKFFARSGVPNQILAEVGTIYYYEIQCHWSVPSLTLVFFADMGGKLEIFPHDAGAQQLSVTR
jgi:hypothetical protein